MKVFHSQNRANPTPLATFDIKKIHYLYRVSHYHLGLELTFVVSGEAQHVICPRDGSAPISERIRAGNYFALQYGTRHGYTDGSSDFSVINLLVNPSCIDSALKTDASAEEIEKVILLGQNSSLHIPFDRNCINGGKEIGMLFERLLELVSNRPDGYLSIFRAYTLEILVSMLKYSTASPQGTKTNVVKLVKDYVDIHYSEVVSLTELSEKFHYTPPYISKRFREEFGMTFGQYVQKVRLTHACDILLVTDYSIDRISELVSYSTPIPFRRAFKKRYGMTPGEYRKAHKEKFSGI